MQITRRELLGQASKLLVLTGVAARAFDRDGQPPAPGDTYQMADHWWGMIIDIDRCIGCGNCVRACSRENAVPDGYFRTWVERYQVTEDWDHPTVESPNGAINGFTPLMRENVKSFFVPKLCNHCADSPCTQVCPVGATFISPDGVVLIDPDYCLGCRYCIQAALTAAAIFTPKRQWPTNARSAITGSPRV